MINYIKSELTRLFQKKSTYVFFGGLMILMTLVMLISDMGEVDANSFVTMADLLVSVSIPIFGSKILIDVFADDLSSKSLANILTTGMTRLQFVLAKLIVLLFYTMLIYSVMGAFYVVLSSFYLGNLSVLNYLFDNHFIISVLVKLSVILVYILCSVTIGYLLQKSTLVIVMYLVLSSGVVYTLLNLIGGLLSNKITEFLGNYALYSLSSIVSYNFDKLGLYSVVALVYSLVAMAGWYVVLKKRDIALD